MTTTQHAVRLLVHPIDPARLARIREQGSDEHGNPLTTRTADGGEPLRCCLRKAEPGEDIALISFAPFTHTSPWTEVGPVFVHRHACAGYRADDEFPGEFRAGPRVLRTYDADLSMLYEHNTVVPPGGDVEAEVRSLLGRAGVSVVHVRAVVPQCFTFAVTARPGG
jgi:hypothetical protein